MPLSFLLIGGKWGLEKFGLVLAFLDRVTAEHPWLSYAVDHSGLKLGDLPPKC